MRISEDWPVQVQVPPNSSPYPRRDLVVCVHEFVQTVPPPVALYEVVQGTPDALAPWPALSGNAVLLAVGYLPSGATVYSQVWQVGPPGEVVNARFDGSQWRIIRGAFAAYRTIYDINNGRASFYAVSPGTLADDAMINWGSPVLSYTAAGVDQILDLAGPGRTTQTVKANADAIAAEKTARESADTAFQNALTTEQNERVAADVTQRNQLQAIQGTGGWNDPPADNLASIDARVDALEAGGGIGLPNHHERHETGGTDQLQFDSLADGNLFKKMTAQERPNLAAAFSHAQDGSIHLDAQQKGLLTGGQDCPIHHHDSRYYTKYWLDDTLPLYARASHKHDDRYLRLVFSAMHLFEPAESRLMTTLDRSPDNMAISYAYPGTNDFPTQPAYALGGRTSELSCWVKKVGGDPDKDYEIYVQNRSTYRLWINIDIFGID
ncbi:MAG: hypothetical protein HY897_15975 [Deltaproteobacteria bacterium]|nr:hypothetical protein [Deltaproteobacteria bacterium]